jgi:hypothetical protein
VRYWLTPVVEDAFEPVGLSACVRRTKNALLPDESTIGVALWVTNRRLSAVDTWRKKKMEAVIGAMHHEFGSGHSIYFSAISG